MNTIIRDDEVAEVDRQLAIQGFYGFVELSEGRRWRIEPGWLPPGKPKVIEFGSRAGTRFGVVYKVMIHGERYRLVPVDY
jgi:hypothetical protein